jgi:hypothetical protein
MRQWAYLGLALIGVALLFVAEFAALRWWYRRRDRYEDRGR